MKKIPIKHLYSLTLILSSFVFVNICISSPTSLNNNHESTSNVKKILILGDSLSSAYNMPIEKGWVSLLENFTQQQTKHSLHFINASISGETTAGGLTRLTPQLEKHQPDIVIIELGGNDGLRGFALNTIRSNLEKMIENSQQYNSQILLAGIRIPPNYGRTYTERFSQLYQDLAREYKITLIPFILEGVATQKNYMQADGIHPNQQAQPIIVNTVWEYLEPVLNSLKSE